MLFSFAEYIYKLLDQRSREGIFPLYFVCNSNADTVKERKVLTAPTRFQNVLGRVRWKIQRADIRYLYFLSWYIKEPHYSIEAVSIPEIQGLFERLDNAVKNGAFYLLLSGCSPQQDHLFPTSLLLWGVCWKVCSNSCGHLVPCLLGLSRTKYPCGSYTTSSTVITET